MLDYRGLNEQTEHDSYSLPLIDTILQKQQKKQIFTVLDLKHGYHQMPLHPDSRPCTAMSTPLGPIQWKVVPMGARNGNAAFQRMMEDLLGPVRDCADPFVDDIIIGSGTENMTEDELIEAQEKDLRRVLSEPDKHNMVCKPTKAALFVKEVEFAGHVVCHGQRRPITYDFTMSPDPENSVAGLSQKPPRSRFSRGRKHFWLILQDLCQFCALLSRFKKCNLPIAIISCSCDQMTVIPSTFTEIFLKYRLFGPFLTLFHEESGIS